MSDDSNDDEEQLPLDSSSPAAISDESTLPVVWKEDSEVTTEDRVTSTKLDLNHSDTMSSSTTLDHNHSDTMTSTTTLDPNHSDTMTSSTTLDPNHSDTKT